jgi:putative membrane protein
MQRSLQTLAIPLSAAVLCLAFQPILSSQQTESSKPPQYGPKIEPAAMGSNYNPLLWRGADADFARAMIHDSFCQSELSKVAQSRGSNPEVAKLAAAIARTQGKLNRQLVGMARSISFPNPKPKKDAPCPGGDRLMELSGQDFDSAYIDFVSKTYAADVARLQEEEAADDIPANFSLRAFAAKARPTLQDQQQTITSVKTGQTSHSPKSSAVPPAGNPSHP